MASARINSSNSACITLLRLLILCVIVCGALAEIDNEDVVTVDEQSSADETHWSTFSPGDVRCYCNLPVCVGSSYMCKSEGGGCFSEVVNQEQPSSSSRSMSPQADVYKGRHGCLELLPDKDQRTECRNMPNKGSSKGHSKSIMSCCFKDMCNHVDSPETQIILNGTLLGINLSDSISQSSTNVQHEQNMAASPSYNSNEVWFKAAIIAVPICGAIILFLLIFLAVKILRTDTLSTSSKLGGPYTHGHDRKSNRDHFEHVHHQSSVCLKKMPLLMHHLQHDMLSGACTNHSADELLKHTSVPLLVQNETGVSYTCEKKNEANAKLNTAHGHEYNLVSHKERETHASPLLGLHKPLNITCSNNVYRNVNLSVAPASAASAAQRSPSDKLYDKQALSAVISWGAPSPSSSPV